MSFILIANKADACSSPDGRKECEAAIKAWCESKESTSFGRIPYFCASALTGSGVSEAFHALCRQILLDLAQSRELDEMRNSQ